MTKQNEVILTGIYTTRQITDSFVGQMLAFDSKKKDGSWGTGYLDIYIKDELLTQYGIAPGDTIKIKGFVVFNFFAKADGSEMTFPKIIVNEILEIEKAGTAQVQTQTQTQPQTQPQPQDPNAYSQNTPPVPGSAPQAPNAAQAFDAPPVPPVPGQ
jgi:hypothetical protein